MSKLEQDAHWAKKVIESLRNSGQPPKLGASALNVGTDGMLRSLEADYLEDHCASFEGMDGGGVCKWVEADFGNGKTQFLRCAQEMAWRHNYVTAYVELSQDECPLDRPDRVFGAVAKSLQAQPASPADVDRTRGLDQVLTQLLDRRFNGVLSGVASDDGLRTEAVDWVNSLRSTPLESTALRTAAIKHLVAMLDGDAETEIITRLYLRGEPVPAPELKKIGVYEKLDQASAFRLLRSTSQLLQRSGLAAGTVFLFDEARQTLSLMSAISQKKSCENLLSVINHCNSGDLPGTMFLYAVMPEFFTNFADAFPALQQRCGLATRIKLMALPGLKELDLLKAIARKVVEMYDLAYASQFRNDAAMTQNLELVADAVLRKTMGTGTRRLLVTSCVRLLDSARENGITEINAEDAQRLTQGTGEALKAMETAQVDSEGE